MDCADEEKVAQAVVLFQLTPLFTALYGSFSLYLLS